MTTEFQHSFWLVPIAPMCLELSATIQSLSAQYGGSAFEPHVTVFAGKSTDEEAVNAAKRVSNKFGPIDLRFDKIQTSKQFSKTLFIEFLPKDPVVNMNRFIATEIKDESDYVVDPHLSLLYQNIDRQQSDAIRAALTLPKGGYLFDRLSVIESEVPLRRPDQVARWRQIVTLPLKGSAV